MRSILLFLFLPVMVFAQHSEQPTKENLEDLRTSTDLFRLEDVKSATVYTLERSPYLEHYLHRNHNEENTVKKTDSRIAQKMEADFVARFIRAQYEHPTAEGECKILYRLSLKGEAQNICEKDDGKTREFRAFIEELKKRF